MSVLVHGIIAFAVFLAGALLLLASVAPSSAAAQASAPPALAEILEVDTASARQVDVTFADETRRRAMATAARAWGAQAGTRHRGWEIGVILERYAPQLHGIYRFRDLMIREAGFMVQPPVLAETRDAFILARDHSAAASARRVVRILAAERIVSTVPTWRDFLERTWPEPTPPAAVPLPGGPGRGGTLGGLGDGGLGIRHPPRRRDLLGRSRPPQRHLHGHHPVAPPGDRRHGDVAGRRHTGRRRHRQPAPRSGSPSAS